MAFVIPILTGAFGAATAAIAAGTAGFAAYATVAGTVLGGLGAITGEKGLARLGAVLSLGAGVSNWAGSASTTAAGGTTGAADLAAGAERSADLGFMAGDGGIATNAANTFDAGAAASTNTPFGSIDLSGAAAPAGADGMAGQAGGVVNAVAEASPPADGSLMSRAMGSQQASQAAATTPFGGVDFSGASPGSGALEAGAKELTQQDVSAFLQKRWADAKTALANPGQFLKNNKELVSIGGAALNSAYGPQAQELAYRKSLMAKAQRNLNSPVEIKYGG